MTREAILRFAREYIVREGKPPSIRIVEDNVPGVDRANFYDYFASKSEFLNALGIKPDKRDLPKTNAMEAKKKAAEKDGESLWTPNRTQSEKLIAIAYMDGKPASIVFDELLEAHRQVRLLMAEVNGGTLDSETIESILNPDLVYEGWNVSKFAGKPWILLNCIKCGSPIIIGEGTDYNKWLLEVLPVLKRAFRPTCEDCLPKPSVYIRIPAR